MENPFIPKEKVVGDWASPRAQGSASTNGATRYSISDDPLNNFAEIMNFDSYAGWCCSPSTADPMFTRFSLSPGFALVDAMNLSEQNASGFLPTGLQSSIAGGEELPFHGTDTCFEYPSEVADRDDSAAKRSCRFENEIVPRPIKEPLAEKMLKALSLLKESSGGGILAQVWVPIKHGDQYLLSTCEQPYLLDQMLTEYREVSRGFTFSAEEKPGTFLGLPGRVFISKVSEWTSNVVYYNKGEYLRIQHAMKHEVCGSIALPVFEGDTVEESCCAVLELVTMTEKPNFDSEMENVCRALQAVNLRSTAPPRLCLQSLSKNQRAALADINDVVRVICHAHRLPLALTWIPCSYNKGVGDELRKVHIRGNYSSSGKCILCVEDTACYVNNQEMAGFVHACTEHYLEEGQGVAGKALQSNHPFFYPDVKEYDISHYPLVQHARKFGLTAAVAIRLRSTYTRDDDYILEFFLPVNMKGCTEQQLLLNYLSSTMQRICRSLRTVSEEELVGFQRGSDSIVPKMPLSSSSQPENLDCIDRPAINLSDSSCDQGEADCQPEQSTSGSRRQPDKKRRTSEKTVSLNVLQQYFSGSLKEAAKSIGVCPTTLKRICRQHGISRWPSRKINKVNRSLRKIESVLNSVQGVEGGLKFDPSAEGLIAAGSVIQQLDVERSPLFPNQLSTNTFESAAVADKLAAPSGSDLKAKNPAVKLEDDCFRGEKPNFTEYFNSNVSKLSSSLQSTPHNTTPWKAEKSDLHFISQSSSSLAAGYDEMDTTRTDEHGICNYERFQEQNQPTSSGTSDSSSGSMINCSSSSSPSCGERNTPKTEPLAKITVKATYSEDTVRFKFEPSAGCFKLYEEVGRRFKLQYGTFQLRYPDDEEEWVMLVTESDLQECLDIMDSLGTCSVKFLVRDVNCVMGSSGGSNCFLKDGSQ